MFSIEIKFKIGDREVSLERFATLFLKEVLRSEQMEITIQPAPVKPVAVAASVIIDRKEPEPRAVGPKQVAFVLGVSEYTVRAHVRQGKIPPCVSDAVSSFQSRLSTILP